MLVTFALAVAACSGGGGADGDTAGRTGEPSPTTAAEPVAREEVRFATTDGVELVGTAFGPPEATTGIVLAHMRGRDQSSWFDFAEVAARRGYQVLTFDFRGYGQSGGERDTALDVDLRTAVEVLRSRGVDTTVVMGASMGGTAAVNVASGLDLTAVVALSPPADFLGLPALDVAADVTEALLVVVAADDQPYADAASRIDSAAPASQLVVLSGRQHGTNLFDEHGPELTDVLFDFLDERTGN